MFNPKTAPWFHELPCLWNSGRVFGANFHHFYTFLKLSPHLSIRLIFQYSLRWSISRDSYMLFNLVPVLHDWTAWIHQGFQQIQRFPAMSTPSGFYLCLSCLSVGVRAFIFPFLTYLRKTLGRIVAKHWNNCTNMVAKVGDAAYDFWIPKMRLV